MVDIYDSKTGKKVTTLDEFFDRKVFYIHGTISDTSRWRNYPLAITQLNHIAFGLHTDADFNREFCNFTFRWGNNGWFSHGNNWFFNTVEDRRVASEKLLEHIKSHIGKCEEVVLIGHSHGGNVAIQVADKIFGKLPQIENVYIITIGTPAFNRAHILTKRENRKLELVQKIGPFMEPIYLYKNCENPDSWKNHKRIKHIALWNTKDIIDEFALVYDMTLITYAAMTMNSDKFDSPRTVNVPFEINNKDNLEIYKREFQDLKEWVVELHNLEQSLFALRKKGYILPALPTLLSYQAYIDRKKTDVMSRKGEDIIKADNTRIVVVRADPFLNDPSHSLRNSGLERLFVNRYKYYDFLHDVDRAKRITNRQLAISDYAVTPEIQRVKQDMLNQTKYLELYQLIKALENASIQTHSFDLANSAEIEKAIKEKRIIPFEKVRRDQPTDIESTEE